MIPTDITPQEQKEVLKLMNTDIEVPPVFKPLGKLMFEMLVKIREINKAAIKPH